jgi:hypothetical protein
MKTNRASILLLATGMTLSACHLPLRSVSLTPTSTMPSQLTATLTPIQTETHGLPVVTLSTETKTYSQGRLGITFDYPAGWYLQDSPTDPAEVILTSFDPASPPHKLEWDETTIRIEIRSTPRELTSDSFDEWVENTKREAIASNLSIFAEEMLTLASASRATRITVVSGSGGILDYVLVDLNGQHLEFVVQGNFPLARTVLDTLRPFEN